MSELRQFFERWQRLEEAKAELGEDLKELFAEAKSRGHNTKAMRLAFREKVKADSVTDDDRELAALVDLYLAEIDAPLARPAPARVENIEEIPPHDAETGEIVGEPQPADGGANIVHKHTNIQSGGGEVGAVNAPSGLPDADSVEPPPSVKKRLLRPHCQRPELCRSGTTDHCLTCKRAMQEEAA